MSGQSCARPGCAGTVTDGYCDTCGLAPIGGAAPTPGPASGAAAAPAGDGSRCARPGCGGTLQGGYCDTCGLAPLAGAVVAAPPAPTPAARPGPAQGSVTTQLGAPRAANPSSSRLSARAASSVSRGSAAAAGSKRSVRADTSRTGTNRLGAGLVTIAAVPTADPRGAVMKVPEVAEEKRFCWSCGQAVGRAKGGREGRTSGFCPNCGANFDFDPKLGPGLIVGGQYEVIGCLAHGGFGWIYLAVDKNVSDRAVVLKGVLNQGDTEAVAAAIAEQRFLAELEHGNIVEIYNFVEHAGNGYIVMEFVGGKSLKTILKDRMVANGGRANPMPVDQAIAYMLGILPALGYLHRQGYLYCDFKPDNVMHQGEDLKLIDLGGVRKIDDDHSSIYGTVGFQAPEIATMGTSISSDVYTVVRTLAVMTLDLPGYQNQFKHSLPDVAAEPLFQKYESFYRLLIKGTAENPDDRFQSVDELSDQLVGVLREVVAVDTRQPRPSVSNRFTGDRWQPKTGSGLSINDLPDLKPNLEDPAASFLAEIVTDDPVSALTKITAELDSGRVPDTIEVKLRAVRAYGESDDVPNAQRLLAAIRSEDPWEWRASWYEGLVAMSRGTFPAAVLEFDRVRTDVPGELAPKLAAAMAAEGARDYPEAAALYELVLQVDSAYVTAAFGLARCRVAMGDVDGAVAVLDKVPTSSAARGAAMEEIGRVLLGRAVATGAVADAAGAAKAVEASTSDARRRAELSSEILDHMLLGFSEGRLQPEPQLQMFGQPATEPGVRTALEGMLRELARTTSDRSERIRLVDQANKVRPRTLW